MLGSVFAKTIFDRKRSIVGWAIAIVGLAVLTIAVYPSIREQQGALADLVENYPESVLALLGVEDAADLFSPAGYLNSQLFANVVPLMLIIFAVSMGTAATAGEERDGTLDLLLSHPISRDRVIIDKFSSMVTLVAGLGAVLFIVLAIGNGPSQLDLGIDKLFAVNVGVVLLAVLFGAIALAVGAFSGNRPLTLGTASAVAVVSFFIFGLAPLVDFLEPLQRISPFEWFVGSDPLTSPFPWGAYGLLAGVTALLFGASIWGFRRREVGT